jgi:hypothetical protein
MFPHYLFHLTVFRKTLLNIKCMLLFSLQILSETFVILWRIQRVVIIKVYRSSCKAPLFLSEANENWFFSTDFLKILKYQISWKSVQWEPSSIPTDRRTDKHDEANSRFSHFCECAQKYLSELRLQIQFGPRSKHTPSRLLKPMSYWCTTRNNFCLFWCPHKIQKHIRYTQCVIF